MLNQIHELVGGDMNSSGGDRNVTNNSEIETGPVDKPFNDDSNYEKGMPVTTDKVTSRYRQNIPWFAVYSYGGNRTRTVAGLNETKKNKMVIKKKAVEEKIEDLVKKSKSSDITYKGANEKIEKLINTLNDIDLTDAEIKELTKVISLKQPKENNTIG